MPFTYVGTVPGHLESGRPLVFGDELDSVSADDEQRLGALLLPTPEVPASPTTSEDT